MRQKPLILQAQPGATPISLEDAIRLFGPEAILAGELRGDSTHRDPWSIITSYKAHAVTATWKPGPAGYDYCDTYTLHGIRTISAPWQSGYNFEGYVSIAGKRRSCFTSSILFKLPDGRYIDVAVIHARTPRPAAEVTPCQN
jgi:hypothetical protein